VLNLGKMAEKTRGQNLNRTLFLTIKFSFMGLVLGSLAIAFQNKMNLSIAEMEAFALIYSVLTFVSSFLNGIFEMAWEDVKDIHLSMLGLLNSLVFQWFWVRIAMVVDSETQQTISYKWIKVYPLSGWSGTPLRFWGEDQPSR
jgi:hypothetical protein